MQAAKISPPKKAIRLSQYIYIKYQYKKSENKLIITNQQLS